MTSMSGQKVVIIGGSSGIGLATAKAAAKRGASVIIAGRTPEKLDAACQEIAGSVEAFTLNMNSEDEIRRFFEEIGSFDHLTTPGGVTSGGSIQSLDTETAQQSFDNKFWGQYFAAKYGASNIRSGGSIVLISGQLSQKPVAGTTIIASVNSAVEGLGRALSLDLAPIRVNICSPGLIDTPRHWSRGREETEAFASYAESLPVKRIGQPHDVAEAILYLMNNRYTTWTTLSVDGGAKFR